jgi:gliding motility-associated-like protein
MIKIKIILIFIFIKIGCAEAQHNHIYNFFYDSLDFNYEPPRIFEKKINIGDNSQISGLEITFNNKKFISFRGSIYDENGISIQEIFTSTYSQQNYYNANIINDTFYFGSHFSYNNSLPDEYFSLEEKNYHPNSYLITKISKKDIANRFDNGVRYVFNNKDDKYNRNYIILTNRNDVYVISAINGKLVKGKLENRDIELNSWGEANVTNNENEDISEIQYKKANGLFYLLYVARKKNRSKDFLKLLIFDENFKIVINKEIKEITKYSTFRYFEISSNANAIYVPNLHEKFVDGSYIYINSIYQFHTLDTFKNIKEVSLKPYINSPYFAKMNSNGKLWIYAFEDGKVGTFVNKVFEIYRPDSLINLNNLPLQYFTKYQKLDGDIIDTTFNPRMITTKANFPASHFPKFKPLHKICIGGGGKIPNLSDTSEYERFVWYISDNDSLEGHEVQPTYSEPGKYLLKLKAYSKYGYYSWFSDSVIVTENPEPSFKVEADTGCQFVAFDFENTTDYRGFEPEEVEMLWDFGDGQTSSEINPKHTYKKSGNYTVKLTTSIGSGCKSTYEYPLNIVIKPAPEPKLIISDTVGCSPLTISYSPAVTEDYLSIKHVIKGDTLAFEQGEVTYYEPGEYEITQIVEAENGCRPTITKKITVYRGISPTETVKNLYASYTDSGVLVRWGALQGAAKYKIQYADEELVTIGLEFLHNTNDRYDYSITAIDSCGNMSQSTVISPIYLTGSTDPQNFAANLGWSSYPTPDYCAERLNIDSSWENLGCVNSLNFSDEEFADDESFAKRCYRVRSGTEPKSYSNVICLPFVAQLWIPNAFSPNADGINDVWQLRGIGIKEIKVSVYNRWGQLVYDGGRLTDSWDGDNAQEGVYLYIVQYQENSGRKRLEKGVLRVVR